MEGEASTLKNRTKESDKLPRTLDDELLKGSIQGHGDAVAVGGASVVVGQFSSLNVHGQPSLRRRLPSAVATPGCC